MKVIIFILLSFNLLAGEKPVRDWLMKDGGRNAHLWGATAITLVSSEVDYHFTKNRTEAIWVGFISGIGTALIKDFIWDKALGKGTFSYWDVFYGCWATVVTTLFNICRFDFIESKDLDIDPFDSQIVKHKKTKNSLIINGIRL